MSEALSVGVGGRTREQEGYKGTPFGCNGLLGFPEEGRGDLRGGESGRDSAEGRFAIPPSPPFCDGCVRLPAVMGQDGGRGWTRRGVVEVRDWDGDWTAVSDVGERIRADT